MPAARWPTDALSAVTWAQGEELRVSDGRRTLLLTAKKPLTLLIGDLERLEPGKEQGSDSRRSQRTTDELGSEQSTHMLSMPVA